jgi:hypothetical protein
VLRPAQIAVARAHLNVSVPKFPQCRPRSIRQRRNDLDCIHLVRQLTEHRRLISGSGSDLEHAMIRLDVERLGHERHDVGLGNRLTVTDWQRRVPVGTISIGLGNKQMSRDLEHRLQHSNVADIARSELIADHPLALAVPVAGAGLRPGPR